MALDYTSLFEDLGGFIKAADQLHASAAGTGSPVPHLPNLLTEILNTLASNNSDHIVDNVATQFASISSSFSGQAAALADRCDQRLIDRDTVINELLATNQGSLEEIVAQLIRDMNGSSNQTVNQSVVTVGSAVAASGNVGNGTLLMTKVLDGAASPDPNNGVSPHLDYKGIDSELVVPSDIITLTCTSDADSGSAEGQEAFRIEGKLPWDSLYDHKSEGSGAAVTILTDNASSLVANPSLESWNVDGTPVSWDVDLGVAGSDFVPDYDSANIYRGNAALKFNNAGDVTLSQTLPNTLLTANRQYRLSLAYKTAAVSAGTLYFEVYSPSQPSLFSTQRIEQLFTVSTTNPYQILSALITMPDAIPDDLVFRLRNVDITGELWVDSLAMSSVSYVGGIGYNLIAGSTPFVRGDRFSATHSNAEGVIQRFFRRKYRAQLPSSGTPTISDSVAT